MLFFEIFFLHQQVLHLEAEHSAARAAMTADTAAERERVLQVASRAVAAREAQLLAELAVARGDGGGLASSVAPRRRRLRLAAWGAGLAEPAGGGAGGDGPGATGLPGQAGQGLGRAPGGG